MNATVRVGVIVLAALFVVGATHASASMTGSQWKSCGTVAGPGWKDPAFGKSGNKWLVGVSGVPCSYAKQWATKLVKTPWRGEVATKLRGPTGWKCIPRLGGTVSTKGTPGECRKGGKLFFWGPKV